MNRHFMGNNEIGNEKMELFQSEIRCLQIARMQDFAPITPELVGVLSGPQTPARKRVEPPFIDFCLRACQIATV